MQYRVGSLLVTIIRLQFLPCVFPTTHQRRLTVEDAPGPDDLRDFECIETSTIPCE